MVRAPYDLYLDHLERCLTGLTEPDALVPVRPTSLARRLVSDAVRRAGYVLAKSAAVRLEDVENGRVWPLNGLTMIGLKRLRNIRLCAEEVLRQNVPGDFIEAGVWRGGAGIFMKAILAGNTDDERTVWLADSFRGLPPPDPLRFPADAGKDVSDDPVLAVAVEDVRENFTRYGLLDDRVRFVEGWFDESLPRLHNETFALVRLDGDLYASTIAGLTNLYPRLSSGGFIIIDDYGNDFFPGCRQAVDDYRGAHEIREQIQWVDQWCAFWRKR